MVMGKFLLSATIIAALLNAGNALAKTNEADLAKKPAQGNSTETWNEADSVTANLQKRYPSTKFQNVKESVVKGIFEVTMGKNVGYVEKSGRYFFFGKLFDMQTQTDLSQSPRAQANKVDFEKLPIKDAIKFKKGNGKRVFAVFSDPDCPYCKQLESTLSRMDNYTMYVFLMPIASLHADSESKAQSIWCAKDPAKAWQDLLLDGIKPKDAQCENPIERNKELAALYEANGTPTLVHKNGQISAGAMSREALESWLNEKDAPQ